MSLICEPRPNDSPPEIPKLPFVPLTKCLSQPMPPHGGEGFPHVSSFEPTFKRIQLSLIKYMAMLHCFHVYLELLV